MRRVPVGVRVAVVGLAVVAPFIFPWQFSIPLGFAAALVYPPLALFLGFLSDILYHPGQGLFIGTLLGITGFAVAWSVRYIVRTRIM